MSSEVDHPLQNILAIGPVASNHVYCFITQEPLEDGKFYDESDSVELKKIKKRRREKHRTRYSPEYMPSQNVVGKHHNRKRKHKSLDTSSETEAPRQGIKLFVSIFQKKK